MMDIVDDIIKNLFEKWNVEPIRFSNSEIILSKNDFDLDMIDFIYDEYNLDIHFEYKIDDDIPIVELLL